MLTLHSHASRMARAALHPPSPGISECGESLLIPPQDAGLGRCAPLDRQGVLAAEEPEGTELLQLPHASGMCRGQGSLQQTTHVLDFPRN